MSIVVSSLRLRTLRFLAYTLMIGLVFVASADETKDMLSQVSKDLRQAQRSMFSGKTDEAIAALPAIKETLLKLKESDPENSSVKSAESKYTKLVKDLERRTGKDLGGGTLTAESSSSETAMPDKPESQPVSSQSTATDVVEKVESTTSTEKVPYAARKPLSSAQRQLGSLERNLADLADPEYGGNKDQLVERIDAKVVEIQELLDSAKSFAAEKGVSSHPDFDEIESKLAEAKNAVATSKGEYQEVKAAAAASATEVNTDVELLRSEYERVRPTFDAATGMVIYYNDLAPVEELIAKIESFENDEKSGITESIDAFASKYGTTEQEIDTKAEAMGYSGQGRASYPYMQLKQGIENVEKTRTVMAEDLTTKAMNRIDDLSTMHDFAIMDRIQDIKDWLSMASRFDADNPMVTDALVSVDAKIDGVLQDYYARIDERTWPEHASNAPKNAESLAKEALKWFANSPDWGQNPKEPRQPLAVVVTGPWSVQKNNLLGEPIMYGLPIRLAVQLASEESNDLARVYILTMRTMEAAGVKMEPPFDHVTVGDSYYIRPSAVK